MGASFDGYTTSDKPSNELQSEFQEKKEEAAWENGHGGYTGTIAECSGLSISNEPVMENAQVAEDWLWEHCEKWSNAIAVRYHAGDTIRWSIGACCSS